jgi:hypothetical protein
MHPLPIDTRSEPEAKRPRVLMDKSYLFLMAAVLLAVEHRQQQAHLHLFPGGNLVMPAKSLLPLQ